MPIIQPKPGSAKQRNTAYRQSDPTADGAFRREEEEKVYYEPEDRTPYSVLEERAFGLAEIRIKNGVKFTKRNIDVLRSLLFPNEGAKPNIPVADQMSMMAI